MVLNQLLKKYGLVIIEDLKTLSPEKFAQIALEAQSICNGMSGSSAKVLDEMKNERYI